MKPGKKNMKELKACYKQSHEGVYQNERGELNYKKMIEEIQEKIRKGENKYYIRKKIMQEHPKKEKIQQIENYISETLK